MNKNKINKNVAYVVFKTGAATCPKDLISVMFGLAMVVDQFPVWELNWTVCFVFFCVYVCL